MLTITVPPELAVPLAEEASRLGTTPELLALDFVRSGLPPKPAPPSDAKNMYEYFQDHIGTVAGTGESFSQDCGKKFADGLAAERK